MKIPILTLLLLLSQSGFTGGLALQIEGRLIQENDKYVVIETLNTRYKVKRPVKSSKAIFKMKKTGKQKFRLNADTSLIISKNLVKHPKGVK